MQDYGAMIRSTFELGSVRDAEMLFEACIKNAFPTFILYFVLASVFTTICMSFGATAETFAPMKNLSKFFIIMAMTAIGLNTDVVKLIKSGTKPILLGFSCWMGITITALIVQYVMGIW